MEELRRPINTFSKRLFNNLNDYFARDSRDPIPANVWVACYTETLKQMKEGDTMLKTYYDRHKELQDKYKITKNRAALRAAEHSEEDYDIIIDCCGQGYAHTLYRVIKNKPGLSTHDLAVICDDGNLCFGFSSEGALIKVYTD